MTYTDGNAWSGDEVWGPRNRKRREHRRGHVIRAAARADMASIPKRQLIGVIMKHWILGLLTVAAAPSLAAPPQGLAARVETLRKQVGVPGMAIAIVENDKITLAQGFGARALGGSETVDADTIFPTGSTGKAVTVAALAVLVDQGKIGWTTRSAIACRAFKCTIPG